MSTGKKVLNVFGIIFAWILSIVLVVVLFVTPMTLSAMSVATPKNLAQIVRGIELPQFLEIIGEDLLGKENEEMASLLSTNTIQEIYDIYMTNILSILDSDITPEALTEEKLQDIAHRNIDEFYQMALEQTPELGSLPEEEAKQQLEAAIVEGLKEMTGSLPSTEELKQMLTQEPTAAAALTALNAMDTAKLVFVGFIVILAVLIFVCRLFGFRGFRWLSVDLFVASGLAGLSCVGLGMSSTMITALVADIPGAGLVVGTMLGSFTNGVYIRTGIMFASAVALLVVYILIKKALAKKAAVAAAPVAEPVAAVEAAPVEEPAPVAEAEQTAETEQNV